MGLYYVLLHLWLRLGDAESTVRLLSAIPAVLTVPTLYAVGRRLTGERCARIAAAFVAVNGFFVYYAQEARAYTLVLFLVTLATLFFVIAMEEPPSARRWATYAATAALAVYAHFFAIFVIAAHAGTLHLADAPLRSSRRVPLLAFAGICALVSPLVLFVVTRNSGQLDWLARPGLYEIAAEPAELTGRGRLIAAAYMVALVLAVWTVARRWYAHSAIAFREALVFGWLLLPIVGSLLVSFITPLFDSRYLIVALPGLALAAAIGVTNAPWRPISFALGAAIVLLSARSLTAVYQETDKEDWRGASAYLAAHARSTDGLIVYTMPSRAPLEAYVAKEGLAPTMPGPLYPLDGWGAFSLLGSRTPNLHGLTSSLPRFQRVWLVLSHDRIERRRRRSSNALQTLLASRPRLLEHRFAGGDGIRVRLYGNVQARS